MKKWKVNKGVYGTLNLKITQYKESDTKPELFLNQLDWTLISDNEYILGTKYNVNTPETNPETNQPWLPFSKEREAWVADQLKTQETLVIAKTGQLTALIGNFIERLLWKVSGLEPATILKWPFNPAQRTQKQLINSMNSLVNVAVWEIAHGKEVSTIPADMILRWEQDTIIAETHYQTNKANDFKLMLDNLNIQLIIETHYQGVDAPVSKLLKDLRDLRIHGATPTNPISGIDLGALVSGGTTTK